MGAHSFHGYELAMLRFIIFASLLALQLTPAAFGERVTTTVQSATNFLMESPTNVHRCEVTTNSGIEFTLYPANKIPERIYHRGNISPLTCRMQLLSTTAEDAGEWTIKAYTNDTQGVENETILRVTLRVNKAATIVPSSVINVHPGNSVGVRMIEDFEDLRSCVVTSPQGEEINVLQGDLEDVKLYGQCGVRLTVNSNDTGRWNIVANDGEFFVYSGTFSVQVGTSISNNDHTETHLELGSPATILLGPSNAKFCQMERPDGSMLPLQFGRCRQQIAAVTYRHEGVWTAHSGIPEQLDLLESKTTIETREDSSLNANVAWTENNEIKLLCRVRARTYSFCRFIRPDGLSMHVSAGIGNDRYIYYGNVNSPVISIIAENVHDCGLTILRPADEDFGAWRCEIGIGADVTTGTVLQVASTEKSPDEVAKDVQTTGSKVYAKRGDSFTIKCTVDAVLSYCWLLSPNGTAFSVSTTGSSISHLRYEGSGLAMGECGAVVEAADEKHSGDWSCNMGVSYGPEVDATVSVVVTEGLLYPEHDKVTIDQETVYLHCEIVPGQDDTLDYCRWIRPDGRGFNVNTDNRYRLIETKAYCGLVIEKVRPEKDVGPWICAAGFHGASMEEAWARIELVDESIFRRTPAAEIGVAMGILMAVVICIVVIIIRMRSKRRDAPPDYTKDPKI